MTDWVPDKKWKLMSLLRDITIIKAQTKRISFCKNGWYSSFVFSSRDLQELYSTEAVLEETINHVVLLKHINLKPGIDALTVADFLDDEGVEADLVDALLQAIGHIDLLYLTMQGAHLRITQLRTQDLIIELFYTHKHTTNKCYYENINQNPQNKSDTLCTISMVFK